MKFRSVIFQGRHSDVKNSEDDLVALAVEIEREHTPAVVVLNHSMPIEVLMDFDSMLLFGRQLPSGADTLVIGCTDKAASFPCADEGSIVLIRGYDTDMNPVLLRGMVLYASMTKYVVGKLKLIPYKMRRQSVRHPLNPPADMYLLDDTALCDPQLCQLINISTGGACIVSDYSYMERQPLRLRIGLSSTDGYSFYHCQVVRATPRKGGCFEYGLLFGPMDRGSRESLLRNIQVIHAENEKRFCRKG